MIIPIVAAVLATALLGVAAALFVQTRAAHRRAEPSAATYRRGARWLRRLVDANPLPLVVIGPESNVRLWNRAAEELFGWPEREVGWMLHRSAWGAGYATEAARACLDFAFGELGWARVAHMIHPLNAGSKAVAARLGSTLIENVFLLAPMDAVGATEMWGQTADAWRKRAATSASRR